MKLLSYACLVLSFLGASVLQEHTDSLPAVLLSNSVHTARLREFGLLRCFWQDSPSTLKGVLPFRGAAQAGLYISPTVALAWLTGPSLPAPLASLGFRLTSRPILTPSLAVAPEGPLLLGFALPLPLAPASCWRLRPILCFIQLGSLTCFSTEAFDPCLDITLCQLRPFGLWSPTRTNPVLAL